jgi:hypothetical protein
MDEIAGLIAKFGVPTVLVAALVFIVIRGRINFQYPRQDDEPKTPAPKLPEPPKKELPSGD